MYEASVVGFDEDKDVAVLKIDAKPEKLRPLPVGSSSDLLVGQKVFAIGNPVSRLSYFVLCNLRNNLTFFLPMFPSLMTSLAWTTL